MMTTEAKMKAVMTVLLLGAQLLGCREPQAAPAVSADHMVSARHAADMIHTTLAADRQVYTVEIVQRLIGEQKVRVVDPQTGEASPLGASEEWRSEHAKLPLPAQMFRMGAERVLLADSGFSYVILSEWPINKQNRPRTDAETRGLAAIAKDEPFYTTEVLDGSDYFVAVYPDVAVADACVSCHNQHPDSPRRDFAVGDIMGAVVIRFELP